MSVACREQVSSFGFTASEIEEAVKRTGLLSMELEFNQQCSFQCPYCYVPETQWPGTDLSVDELKDAVIQARDLGARKIIVLGGEPMIYPNTPEMLEFIRGLGLEAEMFTNGTNMTPEASRRLRSLAVTVVLKLNSFDRDIQDLLTGTPGAHDIIQEALRNLMEAGYPALDAPLAISTVICSKNAHEIVDIWRWARERRIEPYVEMITPQGNARKNDWLGLNSERCKEIFHAISELDRTQYGRIWAPQPPLVGQRCLRHLYSCVVNSRGFVLPCVGITLSVGNLREKSLRDILRESQVIRDLRNFRNTIKGACATCDQANECYGCRGAAFQVTGDYLASDPLCWRHLETSSSDECPMPAADLIPQKDPMRVVDRLVSVTPESAVVEVQVTSTPFVSENGCLDETIHFELMAQSVAAMNGYQHRGNNGKPANGLLLGARNLKILGEARVGDTLRVSVVRHEEFEGFSIVRGTVHRGDVLLASGEIKVWTTPANPEETKVSSGQEELSLHG